MTRLLIAEPPLQVLPSLAVAIGLNKAIVLQQVHWLSLTDYAIVRDNRRWVRNTYQAWKERNFPFWDVSTIKRIFLELETEGYLDSLQLDLARGYAAKAYAVNSLKLAELDNAITPVATPPPSSPSSSNVKPFPPGRDPFEPDPLPIVSEPSNRQSLADLCQWGPIDQIINFRRLRQLIEVEEAFKKIRADFTLLPDWQEYWKTQDWRGKKGELPSGPSIIYDTWPAFLAWRQGAAPARPKASASSACVRCDGTGFRLSIPGDIQSKMIPCECRSKQANGRPALGAQSNMGQ